MNKETMEDRLTTLIRIDIEEKTFRTIARNLMCLAYAKHIKTITDNTFECSGCIEEQNNQEGHDCVMLTVSEKIDKNFDSVLKDVSHAQAETTWRELMIESCVPTSLFHIFSDDINFRDESYMKNEMYQKIKKYTHKIANTSLLF